MIVQIIQVCVLPLLGILTKYLVDFLTAKREEAKAKIDNNTAEKYTDMIFKTITNCVIATNQTYVESLKKSGKFDEEAQKNALKMTISAVRAILSEEAQNYIVSISGDLTAYLTQHIEAEVNKNKGV